MGPGDSRHSNRLPTRSVRREGEELWFSQMTSSRITTSHLYVSPTPAEHTSYHVSRTKTRQEALVITDTSASTFPVGLAEATAGEDLPAIVLLWACCEDWCPS